MQNIRPLIAEFFGTAALIFFGCASASLAGFGADLPGGALPIALAFGACLTFLIYAIGPVSGCHINPAVSIGLWAAGRFPASRLAGYIIAQCAGGISGGALLLLILKGRAGGYDVAVSGLGQNGWGAGYLGQYSMIAAFSTEVLATFIFMIAILGATANRAAGALAGLAIGLALTVIILALLKVTGVSLNPARSLGPAVFVGGTALTQLWLFIVAPMLGAAAAGAVGRFLFDDPR